ncbi:Pc22g07280 [Penicillium rubens Wisconsin 54-1255]|uniref:Pc22g07280 protein n=1 Tax=Penicillium rubens (strain ATCC 28089 / DSM 1075 / NRRL 1951 / Wisconsin 54-1255) TaxID=500485 RepID=B6HQX9_PENRW|nr:Pc22g07280 [Penicillium rubens Wisconsin 54-1255]
MDKYTIPLEKAVELTPIPSEPDTFTNAQPLWSFAGGYGVYGGSTVAHCLVAAQKTVPCDYVAHSLHCGFVSPGNPKRPIEYRVERTRDGKSFITRTVHATQKAGVISEAIVNFVRVGTYSNNASHDLVNTQIRYWVRAKDPIQQRSPQAQLAALAYMSDAYLIGAAVQVHDVAGQAFGTKMAMAASLNHTIYFHNPEAVRADEWMCSERESPWAGNDRALVVQRVWSPEGILVATCVQEGVLRVQVPSEKVKL